MNKETRLEELRRLRDSYGPCPEGDARYAWAGNVYPLDVEIARLSSGGADIWHDRIPRPARVPVPKKEYGMVFNMECPYVTAESREAALKQTRDDIMQEANALDVDCLWEEN